MFREIVPKLRHPKTDFEPPTKRKNINKEKQKTKKERRKNMIEVERK